MHRIHCAVFTHDTSLAKTAAPGSLRAAREVLLRAVDAIAVVCRINPLAAQPSHRLTLAVLRKHSLELQTSLVRVVNGGYGRAIASTPLLGVGGSASSSGSGSGSCGGLTTDVTAPEWREHWFTTSCRLDEPLGRSVALGTALWHAASENDGGATVATGGLADAPLEAANDLQEGWETLFPELAGSGNDFEALLSSTYVI